LSRTLPAPKVLRSLQIGQNADRPAGLLLEGADGVDARLMVGALAMAEIEAEDIDAGVEQRGDGFRCRARGAERGDDFGAALTAHVSCPHSGG
jgi:hypothetical protein